MGYSEREEREEEELFIPHFNNSSSGTFQSHGDNIISHQNFRNQHHLHCSKPEPGLIVLAYDEHGYGNYFIEMKGGLAKVQQLIQDKYSYNIILGCSNGLTLVDRQIEVGGCRDMWVINPATKQYLYRVQCVILTLDGSNPKWRVIEAPAISNCRFGKAPISINGYMYWSSRYQSDLVISMDLIEEKFSEIHTNPTPCSIGNLVEIEGHLSNIVIQSNHGLLDIWILEDVHAHGRQWVKQQTIICHSLEEQCHRTQIVSLRNEEITISDYSNKMLFVFDVKLKKLKMMTKIKIDQWYHRIL
ncbi:hypothetical protein NE237_016428 [Protea cynaroides]|uniref:F-box associated beta-propeller type 3 domain-containing protein n=1 Tax=Protea cynaroides TaxID=273540 RepID=A0A9Q0K5H9_9MAGN|nr:hypothetical protein NE237_016428 [Protea cynaroides]